MLPDLLFSILPNDNVFNLNINGRELLHGIVVFHILLVLIMDG